jgi:signal transduction histidine kinase
MYTRVRPLLIDLAITAGLLAVTLWEGGTTPVGWRPFDAEACALTAAAVLPLMTRRRAPVWSLVCCSLIWLVYILRGYWPVANAYAFLLLLYSVAATRPRRAALAGIALGGAVWGTGGLLIAVRSVPGTLAQGLIVMGVVCWAGFGAARLAERNRQLAEATAELTRTQDERAQRAVTHERMRIARELHDVVAHHLSVISIQTGLAKYVFRSDADTAGTALNTVESLIAETLREMRRILVLLRVADEEAYHPAPGLAELPALFERVRAAGVELDVTVTGSPSRLSPGVELCVYRVVQESLTNVLQHAAPTSARVELHHGGEMFTARVIDEGPPGPPIEPRTRLATGHGLIGMRERALLYGGTLEAGPRTPRGFAVRLALPIAGRPDRRPSEELS